MRTLTLAQARRIALAAQGFADRAPAGRVDIRHLRRVMDRVACVQIDSVNVVCRSHELALYSRLGPYPRGLLADAAYCRRELFEYWAHEASLIPAALQPLLRQRMLRWGYGSRSQALIEQEPGYLERVYAEVAERGPLGASDLSDPGDRAGPWWGWSKGKVALEWLFAVGYLGVSKRRNFARIYDLIERTVPSGVLAAATPAQEECDRGLLLVAARALGVATATDLADYFRLRPARANLRIAELAADGALEEVRVEGWSQPAYLHPDAQLPRRVRARALLSPFDSLVWERSRTERLFGFRYRIEIYVPAAQRVYGYYVLPFLLGDRLVARVDLKADRRPGMLLVRSAWCEDGEDREAVASALADELRLLAGWLNLEAADGQARGDLAPALSRALSAGPATRRPPGGP